MIRSTAICSLILLAASWSSVLQAQGQQPEHAEGFHRLGDGHRGHQHEQVARRFDGLETQPPAERMTILLDAIFDSKGQPDREVTRRLAVLVSQHHDLLPRLLEALATVHPDAVPVMVQVATEVGGRSVTGSLLALLSRSDQETRFAVSLAMRQLQDPKSKAALLDLLRDGDKGVRRNAAAALASIGDASCVAGLTALLDDSERWVRHEAARSLGAIADPSAVPPLLESALATDDRYLARTAGMALCEMDDPRAIEFMKTCWQNPESDSRLRAAALIGLTRAEPPSAEQRLRDARRDGDGWVRERALVTWSTRHGAAAIPELVTIVREDVDGLARVASRIFESVNVSPQAGRLVSLLAEPIDSRCRESILVALNSAADPGRIPVVQKRGTRTVAKRR